LSFGAIRLGHGRSASKVIHDRRRVCFLHEARLLRCELESGREHERAEHACLDIGVLRFVSMRQ